MRVAEVWRLQSRPVTIVIGPPGTGSARLGDRVRLEDADGVVHARLVGVELHTKPGEIGLTLADPDGEVRAGQILFCDEVR